MTQDRETKRWTEYDTLNQLATPALYYDDAVAYAAFHQRMGLFVRVNGTHLLLHTGVNICPLDTVSYYDTAPNDDAFTECVTLPCVLAEPCGPHSVRKLGLTTCACVMGYYANKMGVCVPCASAGPSFYCPGNGKPVLCPQLASAAHTPTASSVADCLCPPQTYHFDMLCLPCPRGFFCPLNGTLTPIACAGAGSLTISEGADVPLDCLCSSRAYGLGCEACADTDDCTVPYDTERSTVFLFAVQGWGPPWGVTQLQACTATLFGDSVRYSLIGVTTDRAAVASSTLNQMYWDWLLLGQPHAALSSMPAAFFSNNISNCLYANAFADLTLELRGTNPRFPVFKPKPFGSYAEWNGDYDNPQHTCIAGYEVLYFQILGFLIT